MNAAVATERCSGCYGQVSSDQLGGFKTCHTCRQRVRANELRVREAFAEYKVTRGCDRCGYSTCARALDFHHRDPNTKDPKLGQHLDAMSRKWLRGEAEVENCDLLCSNCHRELMDGHAWSHLVNVATVKRLLIAFSPPEIG